jgi:hypothetical protein
MPPGAPPRGLTPPQAPPAFTARPGPPSLGASTARPSFPGSPSVPPFVRVPTAATSTAPPFGGPPGQCRGRRHRLVGLQMPRLCRCRRSPGHPGWRPGRLRRSGELLPWHHRRVLCSVALLLQRRRRLRHLEALSPQHHRRLRHLAASPLLLRPKRRRLVAHLFWGHSLYRSVALAPCRGVAAGATNVWGATADIPQPTWANGGSFVAWLTGGTALTGWPCYRASPARLLLRCAGPGPRP